MNSGRLPLVVANWKMNKTPRDAAAYLSSFLSARAALPDDVAVAIAPAHPALEHAGRLLAPTPYQLAAQDVYTEERGAFTGEVSASMLRDVGVSLCLVGHSERRRERGEDETDFSRKMRRLAEVGIAPLYCVGETLDERDAGDTEKVLERQLVALDLFPDPPPGLVLAYEPVWAIGTGRSASPDVAAAAHRHLRTLVSRRYGEAAAAFVRILYGGSVTKENAPDLFREEELDGGLVGGASLSVPDFVAIIQAARRM